MKVPPKTVGLFGAKAWLRVVEGQYWLILHAHFLIWIYVHVDIKNDFNKPSVEINYFWNQLIAIQLMEY